MHPGAAGCSEQGTSAGFQTTHWSVVLAAKGDGASAQEATANLCSTYWYPLYAYIRRQGSSPHEAEDLTQEFFCQFIERHSIGFVQPAAGKFRSFLLTCLKNFLANARAAARSQRRGGGRSILPLEIGDAETRHSLEPVTNLTPEAEFERRWAFALLDRTMTLLRQEYSGEKADQLRDLECFLPNGRGDLSRAEVAAKRGVSVGAIDVAIHRLRQRFGVVLRQEVARTVSCEAEIDDEIRYLISVLGQSA